ncbi:hypothetical protein GCM10009654_49580 [Streptomyces hebeiensis]|uniref:HTH luxR-type domain-containing protein n=1 Tax=Streptomyces hebeiensis TaxID=229486 RepID=A0ABN1V2D8_9ACTN
MSQSTVDARSNRAELLARAERAPHALSMFADVSERLRRLLPYDAAVWRVTDPETGIMTAPVHAENIDDKGCANYWEIELFTERVNLYSELAQAPVPVAGLRASTAGDPGRSAVYRDFMCPRGLHDELRVVLRVGGRPQGTVSLFRSRGRRAFDSDDTAFVSSLVTPLAKRLRSYAEPRPAGPPPAVPNGADAAAGPGLLFFDPTGALVSVNDEARLFLAELPAGPSAPSALGLRVPAWLHTVATRARAASRERDRATARIRLRTRSGRWLVCHATCMRQADGSIGGSAVVLEPAKVSDVMPLVADACELSARELQVTSCVARGLSTEKIAAQLFLSPHTVRDHIKAIFEKTGVSSRGELVGLLFIDHYRPAVAGGEANDAASITKR